MREHNVYDKRNITPYVREENQTLPMVNVIGKDIRAARSEICSILL